MSAKNNPSTVQLPPAFAGNLYLIQLDGSSITSPAQQLKPQAVTLANSSLVSQNIQLIPIIPTTLIQHQLTSQRTAGNTTIIEDCKEVSDIPQNVNISLLQESQLSQVIGIANDRQQDSIKYISNVPVNIKKQVQQQQKDQSHVSSPPVITNYVHISDRVVLPRAVATLPPCLRIHRDCIYPRYRLSARVRFGPLHGIHVQLRHPEAANIISTMCAAKKPVLFKMKDTKHVICIDVSDKDKSNWLSLLPLGDTSTANVWLYEEDGQLYGMTTDVILPRTPLTLGYSKAYSEVHKLPDGVPVLDLHSAAASSPAARWQCTECDVELASRTLLHRHLYKHRISATRKNRKPQSRCSQCKRTFATKYSLRRHVVQGICVMNPTSENMSDQPDNTNSTDKEHETRTEQCPTPILDVNRPSDESLQNYTNGLDISTNLFDPDRMPNLDASESDFNPLSWLSIGCRDDNGMSSAAANDLEYAMFSRDLLKRCERDQVPVFPKIKPKTEEKVLCPYCKQSVVKSRNQQHFRNCAARRLQCECGQVFYKKKSLAAHIHDKHSDKLLTKDVKQKEDNPNEKPYKCEECQSKLFKRRGMLVNHMWQQHDRQMSLPVERCERLYPCVVCVKVYRTAAKRKRHTIIHHPGVEVDGRSNCLIRSRVSCPAAACPACPRQYATRAKLNQHVRKCHPQLVPPQSEHGAAEKRKKSTVKQQSPINRQ